jgi:hypothetical protein
VKVKSLRFCSCCFNLCGFLDVIPAALQRSGSNTSSVTLHQGGISSSALGSVPPETVTGNDGGVGLHQSKRKNTLMGLTESGPGIDLHHSAAGSSTDVLGLHQSASSGTSTRPQMSVSSSPPLNTPVASPPSISNLLELSLPSTVGGGLPLATSSGTGLLEVPMQDSAATVESSFVGESSAP